jgi:hypothetical protein
MNFKFVIALKQNKKTLPTKYNIITGIQEAVEDTK